MNIRRTVQPVEWFAIVAFATFACCGCGSPEHTTGVRAEPVCIPGKNALPRVIVYGSVGRLRPEQEQTSALERFLYGPDAGRAPPYRLRNPQGMALYVDRLLVCDQGAPDILAVDLATGRSRSYGDADHPPRCPVDLAVDGEGNVYVADTTLGVVLVYDSSQHWRGQLVNPAGRVSGAERSNATYGRSRPAAVLVHRGTLYVGDVGTRTVARYDLAMRQWLTPLAPGEDLPPLVAPTGLGVTRDDVILVAGAVTGVGHRVRPDGRWTEPVGSPGREPGQFVRPKHVCCTDSGLIFVTDVGRQSVLVFDASGGFLFEVAGGADWKGFAFPAGLVAIGPSEVAAVMQRVNADAVSPPDECVIVSDTLSNESLTVLGVVVRSPQEQTDGG